MTEWVTAGVRTIKQSRTHARSPFAGQGFLWILILRWLIREYIGEVDADGKKVTPKEAMLLWVAEGACLPLSPSV